MILDCICEYTISTIQSCFTYIGNKTELLPLFGDLRLHLWIYYMYNAELFPLFGDLRLHLWIYYMYNAELSSLYCL